MAGEDDKEVLDLKDIENGPLTEANRECRDVLFCLLFLAGLVVMAVLAGMAFQSGSTYNLWRGVDQNSNICGIGSTAGSYPYLYFTNPTIDITARACVSSCPYWDGSTITATTCAGSPSQCNSGGAYTVTISNTGSASGTPTTGSYVGYDTTLTLDRVCIPSSSLWSNYLNTASVQSSFSSAVSQGALSGFINDIKNNWKWLLAAAGVGIVISFLFMFLLRCLAGCIVWLSLFGIMFFLVGTGLIFLYNSGKYFQSFSTYATTIGVPSYNSSYNEPIGWVLIGLGGFFFLVILCCCNRIRLAVAICKSAGQFVSSVCTIVLVPIFQTLLALGLWLFGLYGMVYLVSTATFVVGSSSDYFTSLQSYTDPALDKFYVFIFLTLWVNAFLGAMTIFIIASATCMWYYSHAPGNELSLPVFRSYKMVFRYHWGSLAIGALLVAIVQFIQLMVELFKRQAGDKGGKCMEYVIKCIQCALACLECIIKFINTQAYIQIALRGKNFCYAAKDGFELVWSNPLRYAIVGGIGSIIMFLGKFIIASATAFIFYVFITYVTSVAPSYSQPLWQVALVFVIAFLISMLFMSVYSVSMDSLLQCFIVDETNQKGKGKAKWAPSDLADLMDTEN